MRALGSRMACAAMVLAALASATGAGAAVRVDQDEVIFSVRAPEGAAVYLVGDFNQWNPTVERMSMVGDRYEVGLFLVAGTYRYKFVIDGTTAHDPDNPGPSPERGSPLVLIERSGGLVLSTELPAEPGTARSADVGARYIGALRVDDGEDDVTQRVDARIAGSFDRMRARAIVATHDSSWTGSPAGVDAFFDRGFVDVSFGTLAVRGFENDSTWASADPMAIVGRAGVFGYDAGFTRHGVAADGGSKHWSLRALYADDTRRGRAGVNAVPVVDTSAYAHAASFDASDVLAFEGTVSTGGTTIGLTRRDDRGVNPGAYTTRADSVRTVESTREDRSVSSAWFEQTLPFGLAATGAYGWGETEARAYALGTDTLAAAASVTGIDRTRALLETDRVVVALARGNAITLRYDHTRFTFDGAAGRSRADVHRARLSATHVAGGWTLATDARYTDASYRDTPTGLHVDWPEWNPWLSRWDAFDVADLAGLAFDRYTGVRVSGSRDDARLGVHATVDFVGRNVLASLAHLAARVSAQAVVRGPWYASADARVAWYDEPVVTAADAFWSGYVEAGYRRGPFDLTVGAGFDPLVFDPVISDYADIGREETLRSTLAGGFARDRSRAVLDGLIARERSLADRGTIKVECVIRLP